MFGLDGVESLQKKLDGGADPTELAHDLMVLGKPPQIALLAEVGANFDALDRHGRTWIAVAVSLHQTEVVRALLDAGASPDGPSEDGDSAFTVALKESTGTLGDGGLPELAGMLLEAGADPNLRRPRHKSPLQLALMKGQVELCRRLVERGAEVKKLNKHYQLGFAAIDGSADDMRALMKKGADFAKFKGDGDTYYKKLITPLQIAARAGNTEAVAALLEAGHPIDKGSRTPIQDAARRGRTEVVRMLIAGGTKAVQRTAYDLLDVRDDVEIFQILVATGTVDLERLISSDPAKVPHCIDYLLEQLKTVKSLNEAGYPRSSLAMLIHRNQVDTFRQLAGKGLDLNAVIDRDMTLLDMARKYEKPDLVAWLESGGAETAPDRTSEVLAIWLKRLAKHRQAWPEWAELEKLAAEGSWKLQGGKHLIWEERGLKVEVPEKESVRGLPQWLSPLRAFGNKSGHGIANMSDWGVLGRAAAGDFFYVSGSLKWPPGGLRALMTNEYGSMLLVDRQNRVRAVSGSEFVIIGDLEDFVRYCLRQELDGRIWYSGAYSKKEGLEAFGLVAQAPFAGE